MSSDARFAPGPRRAIALSRAAIAAQVLFAVAMIACGFLQGPHYSAWRHDISDMGALTAPNAWLWLVPQGLAGAVTMAFALAAFAPSLEENGRGGALGGWLVALTLSGLDNLSDAFFRLDCRPGDPGCSPAMSIASWHARLHLGVALVTMFVTALTPFVLAWRFRSLAGWRDLARPAFGFGVLFGSGLAGYALLRGGGGAGVAQRAFFLLNSAGVTTLAVRVEKLARNRTG